MVPEVHARRVDWGVPVPALDADLDRGGGGAVAGVPRGTCTGHWHISTRALVSGGTARGGGGADQAYAYAMAWSHHPGREPPSGVGRRSCTLPSIT